MMLQAYVLSISSNPAARRRACLVHYFTSGALAALRRRVVVTRVAVSFWVGASSSDRRWQPRDSPRPHIVWFCCLTAPVYCDRYHNEPELLRHCSCPVRCSTVLKVNNYQDEGTRRVVTYGFLRPVTTQSTLCQ